MKGLSRKREIKEPVVQEAFSPSIAICLNLIICIYILKSVMKADVSTVITDDENLKEGICIQKTATFAYSKFSLLHNDLRYI